VKRKKPTDLIDEDPFQDFDYKVLMLALDQFGKDYYGRSILQETGLTLAEFKKICKRQPSNRFESELERAQFRIALSRFKTQMDRRAPRRRLRKGEKAVLKEHQENPKKPATQIARDLQIRKKHPINIGVRTVQRIIKKKRDT
jgi:hypothetical protein